MKSVIGAGLVSLLALSGVSLAAQSKDGKDHSSMMQEMMTDGKPGGQMEGMMRMMKMMDKCEAMMESASDSKGKEGQKQ